MQYELFNGREIEKQIEKMKEKATTFLASQPDSGEAELVRRFLARLESHMVNENLWAKFPIRVQVGTLRCAALGWGISATVISADAQIRSSRSAN